MEKDVIVIGAGGHAKVVISTLIESGYRVSKIVDDDADKWGKSILDIEISGPLSILDDNIAEPVLVAIGNNKIRKYVVTRSRNLRWITIVHPSAYVHPTARIGQGTVVFAKAVIQPDTLIGEHCIINTGATIDHDCRIGDYVHISPGVNLAGDVHLEDGVFCGIGSKVINGIAIGEWATVGAGGVVIHDLPEGSLSVGVPAKVMKYIEIDKD